jgi:hypothetical protein
MLADVAVRVRKIYIIDGYIHSLDLRQLNEVSARLAIDQTISILKGNAQTCYATEVMQVGSLLYGLKIFYSEKNRCNWEGSHSIGYVIMFIILTLGMILVFKWFLKLAELIIIVIMHAKTSILRMFAPREPERPLFVFGASQRRPLLLRLREPL